ncbi:hypothetical protein FB451DRAFT_1402337 [Mycena latifolia]|nr:hypothetical protein FB451DRAFT_1402337 [Mycena latifolia]
MSFLSLPPPPSPSPKPRRPSPPLVAERLRRRHQDVAGAVIVDAEEPLVNKAVLFCLNPYAKTIRRHELIKQERLKKKNIKKPSTPPPVDNDPLLLEFRHTGTIYALLFPGTLNHLSQSFGMSRKSSPPSVYFEL